jgi:hypothetical protein
LGLSCSAMLPLLCTVRLLECMFVHLTMPHAAEGLKTQGRKLPPVCVLVCRVKSGFDVAAAWEGRCRKWYGDRYDFRHNMVTQPGVVHPAASHLQRQHAAQKASKHSGAAGRIRVACTTHQPRQRRPFNTVFLRPSISLLTG